MFYSLIFWRDWKQPLTTTKKFMAFSKGYSEYETVISFSIFVFVHFKNFWNVQIVRIVHWSAWSLEEDCVIVCTRRGGSRIFSRGGGGRIFKKFSKFDDLFFFFSLGRPNWFFELSQSTVLALLWLNFLRRRQIFEKTVKKAVFGQFLKNVDKKIAFFWRALPLKISIYWRRRRL